MIEIITGIFASYIITAVLVNGNIFYSSREWIKGKTPWLVKGPKYIGKHMLDCRMCVGFWVSLVVYLVLIPGPWSLFFLIFGAAYFLATQER
jgi:hypothetical protein